MKINSETKYRSIPSQNQLSYVINGNIDNTTGITNFGLSGDNGNLNLFSFKTGKIYDVNNKHIWSYNPSESFTISGNITSNNLNYYINDKIVCLSSPKQDKYYKYFYIDNKNCTTDFNINIYGYNYPNYSIIFPFTNTVGDNITGYIKNNSLNSNLSFQFFDGTPSIGNYYSLKNIATGFISGSNSGEIVFNYTSATNPYSFNSLPGPFNFLNGFITFNTNFATFSYVLDVPVTLRPYYYVDFITNFTGLIDNLYNYNYDLQTKSPVDQTVFISLSNITGHTGDLYYSDFAATGLISGTGYGFIYGQGYINGISSGNLFSVDQDYYGNVLTKSFTQNNSSYVVATGYINYNYNSTLIGGSGLLPAQPGTTIDATGFAQEKILNNIFIYGSRLITGSISGDLTGYWGDLIQTGRGLINTNGTKYFTGVYALQYNQFFWDGIPSIQYDVEKNPNYKIYGITGSGSFDFINSNLGVKNNTNILYTQQSTGILLKKTFSIPKDDINNTSGIVYDSINSDAAIDVFSSDGTSPWVTDTSVSTGYLGIEFSNFSPEDSGIITHYEISLDKQFSNYKYIPYLIQLYGQKIDESWAQMSESSILDGTLNFYNNYDTNIFPVTTTGQFKKVELRIKSSILLPHINPELLNDSDYGLSINKIAFYSKVSNINKTYNNLIPNPYIGSSNYFLNNQYSGDQLYVITGASVLSSALSPFTSASLSGWSSICVAPEDNRIIAACANNYNIYVSLNSGVNWTNRGLLLNWTDIATDASGSYGVACTSNGGIYKGSAVTTLKLASWSLHSLVGTGNWSGVCISRTGNHMMAVKNNSEFPIIFTSNFTTSSANAIIWITGNMITYNGMSSEELSSNNWRSIKMATHDSRYILVGGSPICMASNDSGYNFSRIYPNNDNIDCYGVAISSGGDKQYLTSRNPGGDKIYLNTGGLAKNLDWSIVVESRLTGQYFKNNTAINQIKYLDTSYNGNFQVLTTDNNYIYYSQNGGISWDILPSSEVRNWGKISIGNKTGTYPTVIAATPEITYDYLFSTDNFTNLFNINKNSNITLEDNPAFGVAQYKAFQGSCITGFYINFDTNYRPEVLIIDASKDNINYKKFYTKIGNINSVESGILNNGIEVIGSTGYKFFRFNFGVPEPVELISTSPSNCYSGWWANSGKNLSINSWKSVDMTASGKIQVAVDENNSFVVPYTYPFSGFIYISTGYGNTWSGIRAITGYYQQSVQLVDVKISKKDDQFILACRNGYYFYTGNHDADYPLQQDYKVILSRNSGRSFSVTGLDGAWQSVAISYDGRVMAAVGYDDVTPITAQRSINSGITWSKITPDLDYLDLKFITISSGGNTMYTTAYGNGIYRSTNTGLNWTNIYSNDVNTWSSIATSYDGKCVAAVSKAIGTYDTPMGGFYSYNSGITWQRMNGISSEENFTNISMSSDGRYQLITSPDTNSVYRSIDSGANFYKLNSGLLNGKTCSASAISSGGQYQLIGAGTNASKDWLYSSCIFGQDVYLFTGSPETRIKSANFYKQRQNNFFNLSRPRITGIGTINIPTQSGLGVGFLLNPTGLQYQPAISYDTTLLQGVIEADSSYGTYTWDNVSIITTGKPDTVFSEYITGNIQATGLLIYDTSKLTDGDTLTLNNVNFTYITGLTLSDTDVINYISGIEIADGQPLELSVKSAINNFILGLKNDGIWDSIKASCLMAGPRTINGAMRPLAGSNPIVIGNTFSQPSTYYNRNSGILGDGNSLINTMRDGNADSAIDHHNMVYVTSQTTSFGFQTLIGQSGAGYGINDLKMYTILNYGPGIPDYYSVRVNNRSSSFVNTTFNPPITGLLGVQRSSNQSFELWNNTTSKVLSSTVTSPLPTNSNLSIMGKNLGGGSITEGFLGRVGFYSIGSYIQNPILLQNRLNQYFKDIKIIDKYPRFNSIPYSFSTFSGLVSDLNIGARGGYDETLQYTVGITGYASYNTLTLYSYYLSGEDGNACTIIRNTQDPNGIQIPNVYFTSGRSLRAKATQWFGDFYNEISSISYTNTGYYRVDFSTENVLDTINGIIFENNFSGNWSPSITPISQGIPLDTGSTFNLKYDSLNKIFSGNFIIKSGLSYLGYSGLNIDINKRTYKQYPLKTISVAPAFNDLKFTVVGTVNDQNLYYDFTNQYAIWYLTYDDVGDYYTYIFTYISDVSGYYPNILNNYYCDNPGTNPIGTYSWGAGFSSQNQSSFEIQENKNLAKYTISGINNQFIFTGILEG